MGNSVGWLLLTGLAAGTALLVVKRPKGASHELAWAIIAGLAGVVAFAYTVITTEEQRAREPAVKHLELSEQVRAKVAGAFREFYPAAWSLYREIHPGADLPAAAEAAGTEAHQQAPAYAEHQVGHALIQATELLLRHPHSRNSMAGVVTLLHWWTSPRLRAVWAGEKHCYAPSVQRAVGFLIRATDALVGLGRSVTATDYQQMATVVTNRLGD